MRTDFQFFVADGKRLPFNSRTFDIVICSEVIEHVNAKETLVSEISRVLKYKGWLILSTPNPNALTYFIPRLLSKISKQYRFYSAHVFNELVKPNRLLFLLEKAGLTVAYRSGLILSTYTYNLMGQFFQAPLIPLRRISEYLESILVNFTLYQVILARKLKNDC